MLDRYEIHEKEYVPFCKEVRVEEHRAPTDESIKLLNEMQDSALKNILARGFTENNVLKANWLVYQEPTRLSHIFVCRFTLNNKDYDFEFEISRMRDNIRYCSSEQFADDLLKKVIEKVSLTLMIEGLKGEIGKTLRTLQPE
jgi:hypothetical protein